jgi:type I restriction enzyme S subunit
VSDGFPVVALGGVLTKSNERITLDPEARYKQVTVRLRGKGAVLRAEVLGAEIAATKQVVVRANQFIVSRIDARNGAFAIIPAKLDGAVVSRR